MLLKTTVLAQVTDESLMKSLKQEHPKSSMWGQIGNQMLPFFKVNDGDFEYPEEAMENRTQGQVDVRFKVDADGSIIDSTVQIINSLSKVLDAKAIEIVKESTIKSHWPSIMQTYNTETTYFTTLVFAIQEQHWASFYNAIGLRAYLNANYEKAIKNFTLSVQFDDKNAKTFYSLYRSYFKNKEEDLACDCLRKAKRLKKAYKLEWKSNCK